MPKSSSPFPHTIEKAVALLKGRLPHALRCLVWYAPRRQRAMRVEFEESIRKVLISLVRHFDGASGCSVFMQTQNTATPLTVAHLVAETGLCERTVQNVLAFLKKHHLLSVEPQVRRVAPTRNGVALAASDCYRRLTDALFAAFGLIAEVVAFRAFAASKGGPELGHRVCVIGLSGPRKGGKHSTLAPPDRRPEPPKPDIKGEQFSFAELLKARTGIDLCKIATKG